MSERNKNDAVVGNVKRLRAEFREFRRVARATLKALSQRVKTLERAK